MCQQGQCSWAKNISILEYKFSRCKRNVKTNQHSMGALVVPVRILFNVVGLKMLQKCQLKSCKNVKIQKCKNLETQEPTFQGNAGRRQWWRAQLVASEDPIQLVASEALTGREGNHVRPWSSFYFNSDIVWLLFQKYIVCKSIKTMSK